jgi:hypothetical protein
MLGNIRHFFYLVAGAFLIRMGWYRDRKAQKHPISLFRALFGKFPRFGSYEEDEPGCPDWAKRDYQIVKDAAELEKGTTA